MSDELKPCPFCGDQPSQYASDRGELYAVMCEPVNESDCPVKPATDNFATRAEAIAAWNQRAVTHPATDAAPDGLVERLRNYTPFVYDPKTGVLPTFGTPYLEAADRITALEAALAERDAKIAGLREALELADCALRGANMNMSVVERKITAALRTVDGEAG